MNNGTHLEINSDSNDVAQPVEDGHNDALNLQVLHYKPANQGCILTVRVDRHGHQIFRDVVTVNSFKSRDTFARGLTAALIRETGFSGDIGLYYTLVFTWSEMVLLSHAAQIEQAFGNYADSLLLTTPVAGRA